MLEQVQRRHLRWGWIRWWTRRSWGSWACSAWRGKAKIPQAFLEPYPTTTPDKAGSMTTTKSSRCSPKAKTGFASCSQERHSHPSLLQAQGPLLPALITCGAISSRDRSRKLCRSPYFMNGRITMGLGTCRELSSMHTPGKHRQFVQPHGQRHHGVLQTRGT